MSVFLSPQNLDTRTSKPATPSNVLFKNTGCNNVRIAPAAEMNVHHVIKMSTFTYVEPINVFKELLNTG